jgi:hypothetical protein
MTEKILTPKSEPRAVGLHGLIEEFNLKVPLPTVRSEVISGARKTTVMDGTVLEQYPKGYLPTGVTGNLRFAMRYEPIDLAAIAAVFGVLDIGEFENWVRSEPTGIFARRAWYLFELLTGKTLDVPDIGPASYVDLLDSDLHVTGARVQVRRQRVNDNLLGNRFYCPLVRRTEALRNFMAKDLAKEARRLVEGCDPAILARAVHYLFTKETKSSFAIEGEVPNRDRTARFVAALENASAFDASNKGAFVRLQNAIVDPRYAQSDWRTTQNYFSQTLSDYTEDVHYVCPRPEDIPGLMSAWMRMTERLETPHATDAVVAAAAAAFGFVFLHPFDDGNGRIHRFLVHHILTKLEFTPPRALFPVSAAMLREREAYDRVLERYSASVLPLISYDLDAEGRMTVHNDTASLYRFFDATPHAEYLYHCIEETIRRDLREEIGFLVVFDAAMRKALEIVDMPDRRASLLVRLILQNHGKLSRGKRQAFAEIKDDELHRIEDAVWHTWEKEREKQDGRFQPRDAMGDSMP